MYKFVKSFKKTNINLTTEQQEIDQKHPSRQTHKSSLIDYNVNSYSLSKKGNKTF
jgi:hypothetical protein